MGRFPPNRHFFTPIKDLQRPAVEPAVGFDAHGDQELLVHVKTSGNVFYFHLIPADELTHFSDNYFDLTPGESRTIVVSNQEAELTEESLIIKWL